MRKSKPFLVDSTSVVKVMFKTDQVIPESGIYRVIHGEHRLPHKVTLLQGEKFPRCAICTNEVTFEAVALTPYTNTRFRVVLNQLPEMPDTESAETKAA